MYLRFSKCLFLFYSICQQLTHKRSLLLLFESVTFQNIFLVVTELANGMNKLTNFSHSI